MISNELKSGIEMFSRKIAPLVGQTVTITTPDGITHTGVFSDSPHRPCQPQITTAAGRRYMVSASELERLLAREEQS